MILTSCDLSSVVSTFQSNSIPFSLLSTENWRSLDSGSCTLAWKPEIDDELLLQDNKGGGELFNSAVYLQYWLAHQHDNPD